MRDIVKLGKIEGDQLVGDPEDSDDDLKEIIHLIGQGEAQNIGPSLSNGSSSQTTGQGFSSLPPPKARNETSRFKINRGGAPRPAGHITDSSNFLNVDTPTPVIRDITERRGTLRLDPYQPTRSISPSPAPDTPSTTAERSSPKLPSGDIPIIAANLSSPISRKPAQPAEPSQSTSSTVREPTSVSEILRGRTPRTSTTQPPVAVESPSFHSMIIDSPDFPPPPGVATTMPSITIDSPYFPPSISATSIPSMVIESPDFPLKGISPTSKTASKNTPAPHGADSPYFPAGPRCPGPPRVMSSRVVERSLADVNHPRQEVPGKKVSRFAAERR